MRAAVLHGPRDLRVEAVSEPEVGRGWVLLRVKYVGICGTDQSMYLGKLRPGKLPIIPGHEFVAEVVDGAGRVYSRGYTTPFVATPGTTVRDRAWVYPGRDVRFNVFIPWGRQDRERDMSPLDVVPDSRVIDTVVCRLPRREKRRRVVVKLEIPPKIKIPAAAGKSPAEGRR